MLHHFLSEHREELIERCRGKVAERIEAAQLPGAGSVGIPRFLDQVIETLVLEQSPRPLESRRVSGASNGEEAAGSVLGASATLHGRDLAKRGYTVDQVVHDYGDLCQAITELAMELGEGISVEEFRALNRCLDNGVAVAVTEFNHQSRLTSGDRQADDVNVRLGMFGHELRNYLNTATLALAVIKLGNVGLSGATGQVLDRSFLGMRNLINRSLAEVRLVAGIELQRERFSLAELIAEVRVPALMEAQLKGCLLVVTTVDADLALEADRDLMLSALANLLQNAIKFTRRGTEVELKAAAAAGKIRIEVTDNGPGLPEGEAQRMFLPFQQGGGDKTGVGLGLTIARRGVEANLGVLSARNRVEGGCVFTVELPLYHLASENADA